MLRVSHRERDEGLTPQAHTQHCYVSHSVSHPFTPAQWHRPPFVSSVYRFGLWERAPWPQGPMCRAEDLTYLIFFIGYQYYFAVLKLYALCTLHITTWGTRAGVGGAVVSTPAADGDAAAADSTEIKLQIQHEKHIERKAALERRRAVAESTYAAGQVALLRRVHAARMSSEDSTVRSCMPWINAFLRPTCWYYEGGVP